MPFEKFDESGRGRSTETTPKISLRKSGSIGVNQAALEEHFGENEGAVLYYDTETDQIGIEPVADTDADDAAYTISITDSGGTIAAQAFLERYDLIPAITTQYEPTWDDDHGFLVVGLDEPIGTYGSADDEE